MAQSARIKDKSPYYGEREAQSTVKGKVSPKHFIFTADVVNRVKNRSHNFVGPGGGGSGYNMFGSLNEILK